MCVALEQVLPVNPNDYPPRTCPLADKIENEDDEEIAIHYG